jgi:hypothetical protein
MIKKYQAGMKVVQICKEYQRPHQALENLTPYQYFLKYQREAKNVT